MENKPNRPERVNELSPELLAIHSLNFATANNAPARGVMFASHFAQRPVISGSEPNLIQTGVEEEMGKYTFGIRMPEDGTILRVIPRYTQGVTDESIQFNPETLVIYRSHETGVVDCFSIPYYQSFHPSFGFQYEHKEPYYGLSVGRDYAKDTVFSDSPAVKGESHYTYGKNLNVVYMSHPNVGLDGYLINRDALKHFKFRVYDTRTFEFGASSFPINHYGNETEYKPLPEIGDYIHEDGLLCVMRRSDPYMAPALLSKKDVMETDYLFDEKIYVRAGKGRVVDMTVIHSGNVDRQLPEAMTQQLHKYARAKTRFHREIVSVEEQLIKESRQQGRGGAISISERLQRLIVESKGLISYDIARQRPTITLNNRREPLNTWRVSITVEYEITPTIGFKLSCGNGGKGVVCRIEDPENMPVDADGNVADIVTGPDSVPGRMNLGRLYAPYFNAAARDVRKQVLEEMGFNRQRKTPVTIEELYSVPEDKFQLGISTIARFYKIISARQYKEFVSILTPEERMEWLLCYFNEAPYLYMPIEDVSEETDNISPKFLDEKVMEIEKNFKLVYGPVSYVGRSGRRVVTKNKFRIAPLYIMLLDKIADTWLSADIGKHSNFGILAAMNQGDKYSTPWRRTPPRTISETEGRLYCMYGGREMIAELMDRAGNLATQKEIAKNVISAENPSQIKRVVSREKIELGNARPNQLLHHIFRTAGFDVTYHKEK